MTLKMFGVPSSRLNHFAFSDKKNESISTIPKPRLPFELMTLNLLILSLGHHKKLNSSLVISGITLVGTSSTVAE